MSDRPVALVTGASRGIGRAVAVALAREGYAVVVNFAASRAAADEVVAEIESAGGRALPIGADVSRPADRQRLVSETCQALGRLDLLVNNAGITSPGRKDLLEVTEESWDRVFDVNLKGPFFLSQLAARAMIGQLEAEVIARGTIINVSSISAYAVSTNRAEYCLTKAALGMMTALFATRLAEHAIGVFEIRPGVIASDMTAPVRAEYDARIAQGLTPIRRWGEPQDVARAVVAIASGALSFSTGECINVDGGFHIRRL